MGVIILIISFLFYTYKTYSTCIDKSELDKYSLQTKLIEAANIIIQVVKDRHIYKEYIYSLDIKENDNVLDFGSGMGNDAVFIAERLSKNSGKLTCLDIDSLSLNIAKKRLEDYKNLSLICGDITKLNISANTYDAIVIYNVLHVIDQEKLEKTVYRLFYVLKKGGKLFFREPLSNSSEHNKQLLSTDDIRSLMSKSGFKEISLVFAGTIDGVYQKE